ncbi:uncharacterized protein LOC126108733 isoform X2 [Schistocerca cancellata]|uniref:uncharacterized protein LOC126108733 isoform X2 n=1 Tax=Schistocerca cancellata TaxID=274614 RepID=UPI0021176BD7|nr:uncharacterized protein LOC126108733 isoform X2 [Schistocerca cancellata]
MYRIAAMDQKPPVWMKKEETDEVPSKSGSMDQVYPSSMNVKEELEVGANKELDDGGTSRDSDPAPAYCELEADSATNNIEDVCRYSSSSRFVANDQASSQTVQESLYIQMSTPMSSSKKRK